MARTRTVARLAGQMLALLIATTSSQTFQGSVVDSVTMVPQGNVIVTLAGTPGVCDTTDETGAFSLTGPTSLFPQSSARTAEERWSIYGDQLTISSTSSSDATVVEVYDAAGSRLYSARKAPYCGTVRFDHLWKMPGLYYVKVRTGEKTQVIQSFGTKQGRMQSESGATLALCRTSATATLSFSHPSFAAKQVAVVSTATQVGTIRLKPVAPTLPIVPMTLISSGVPAYASSGVAAQANDANIQQGWSSNSIPAWVAYDLSQKPIGQRQRALVVWYDHWAPTFFAAMSNGGLPRDYTVEINSAPGGGAPPTTGWKAVTTVTGNLLCSRQHEIFLGGANWIRLNITSSTTNYADLDLYVYSAPNGITDLWLLLGDSITFMTMPYQSSDVPMLVNQINVNAFPVVESGALGGTTSSYGNAIIRDVLAKFPGKFIGLAYGTNDATSDYLQQMDSLVVQILAAGRIPVVPTVPWPHATDTTLMAAKKNMVLQLYAKYPQIYHGPDLWNFFLTNPSLIPAGDVHPTGEGQRELRKQWATVVARAYQ